MGSAEQTDVPDAEGAGQRNTAHDPEHADRLGCTRLHSSCRPSSGRSLKPELARVVHCGRARLSAWGISRTRPASAGLSAERRRTRGSTTGSSRDGGATRASGGSRTSPWTLPALPRPAGLRREGGLEHEGVRAFTARPGLIPQFRDVSRRDDADHAGRLRDDRAEAGPRRGQRRSRLPAAPNIVLILTDDPGRPERDARVHAAPRRNAREPRHVVRRTTWSRCRSAGRRARRSCAASTRITGRPDEIPCERRIRKGLHENVEASPVATLLHGAGYRTALFGKY